METRKIVINKTIVDFELSSTAEQWLLAKGLDEMDIHDIARDDKFLVECVETLGEKANTAFTSLVIVEIPMDVEWYVEQSYEHFGEQVVERHRVWR